MILNWTDFTRRHSSIKFVIIRNLFLTFAGTTLLFCSTAIELGGHVHCTVIPCTHGVLHRVGLGGAWGVKIVQF